MPYKDIKKNQAYQKRYQKKWYKNNKDNHIKNVRKNSQRYKIEIKQFILNYKHKHPCISCGETNPICLDFHHLHSKKFSISRKTTSSRPCSMESLEAEIKKCVVLCANCHRKEEHKKRNAP